jgi:hypothetical protein
MCANGELAQYMCTTIGDRTVRADWALAECVQAHRLPLEMDGFVRMSPGTGWQGAWHWRDPPMSLAYMLCAGMLVARLWALSLASTSWVWGRASEPLQLGAWVRTVVSDPFLARDHVEVVRLILWSILRVLRMRRACGADMVGD